MSSPVWEAWIEILRFLCRVGVIESSPVWEAWIEIYNLLKKQTHPDQSSPVWEAWIEILGEIEEGYCKPPRRLPYGRRGLKYKTNTIYLFTFLSSPVWEAWIEIDSQANKLIYDLCRLPYGRRGLKLRKVFLCDCLYGRLPYGRRGLKS